MAADPCPYLLFVGVDIAAASATVAAQSATTPLLHPFTFKQDKLGFAALRKRLLKLGVAPEQTLVVLEATSTYWVQLANDLHTHGYHVSVVNPKQAHHFAQATLKHAKTDPLDAQMLAQLAAKLTPPRWSPPPAIYQQLQQRLAEREDLLAVKTATRNQYLALGREQVVVAAVTKRQLELIALIDEQLAQIEQEIKQLIAADEEWGQSIVRLQSIPGVALWTAAWLVVSTLNFSRCADAAAASAYLGLAPHARQSGTSVRGRGRVGRMGNGVVRKMLYMASLSAARYIPALERYYQRLLAAGKAKKLAHCAVARKLVHLAFALVTKRQVYVRDYNTPQVVPSS